MDSSENSGGRLQTVYRQLVAVILLLLVLAVLGYRYFEAVPGIVAQGLQVEQTRLLNVLAMTRSKWLGEGQPPRMLLSWVKQVDIPSAQASAALTLENTQSSEVLMASGGWPLPHERSAAGCARLWYQLLGVLPDGQELQVQFDGESFACWFIAGDGSRLSYRLDSGEVNFLTSDR
ncbi:hypothetical protein [Shewanella sp. GXUN23E]|uniref:hypothetical protein n=1 Tax=Shewanella sp. GXUN23E TaxID=3422498 RepID=UPI003D7D9FB1